MIGNNSSTVIGSLLIALFGYCGTTQAQISNLYPRGSPDDICGSIGETFSAQPRSGVVQAYWPADQPDQHLLLAVDGTFEVEFFVLNCLGRDLTPSYQLQFYAWHTAYEINGPLGDGTIARQLQEATLLGSFPINGTVRFLHGNFVFGNFLNITGGNAARGIARLEMAPDSWPGTYKILGCPTRVRGLNGKYALSLYQGASLVCGVLATLSVPARDEPGGGPNRLDWAVRGVWVTKEDHQTLDYARTREVFVTIKNSGPTAVPSFDGHVSLSLIDRRQNRVLETLGRIPVPAHQLTRPGDSATVSARVGVPETHASVRSYRNREGRVERVTQARLIARLSTSMRDAQAENNVASKDISLIRAQGCELLLQWTGNDRGWLGRSGEALGGITWDFVNFGDAPCEEFEATPVRRRLVGDEWGRWTPLTGTTGAPITRTIPAIEPGGFIAVAVEDHVILQQPGVYEYSVMVSESFADQTLDNHQGEGVAIQAWILP